MGSRQPRALTHYWQPTEVPGLSCLHATFTAQHFSPHSHEALVVAVTRAGASAYTSRRRSAEAHPSVLLVFNPDEPHAGHMRHSRYWRYRAFYLGRAALDGVLASLGRASLPGFTSNAVSDGGLIDRFVRAHRAFECGDSECGRELLIEGCADLFARAATGGRRDDLHYSAPVVDNALATIRGRFRERITLDELAGAQHLSPYQLIRAFRRVTGMPPHAHVTRARLHEAIRLIKRGVPLAEAATGAGFYDQSALTRHFRRAYGITPGQFITAQFSPIR